MTQTDLSYFERRAEQEFRRAQAAASPTVAQAHYELSKLLLDRAALLRRQPGSAVTG